MKLALFLSGLLLSFSTANADGPAYYMVAKCRVTKCTNTNTQNKLDLCTVANTFTFYKYAGLDHPKKLDGFFSFYNDSANDLDLVGWAGIYPVQILETTMKYKVIFPSKEEGWADLEIERGENKTSAILATAAFNQKDIKATFNLNCQSRL